MIQGLAAVLLILVGLNACSTIGLSPLGTIGPLDLEEDEKRLWVRAEEEQKRMKSSGIFYEDAALETYVNGVAQQLVPENVKRQGLSIHVKIIKNPHVNAFAYPNGLIFIHTGFLAKMENEAQLATVLAHEIAHVIHRHSIQGFRNLKNTAAVFGTLQVVAAPAGIYGLAPIFLGAVASMAAVSGHSKEMEREADKVGMDLLIKSGHDLREAVRLFERVEKYIEEEKINEPFFFGSHPRLQERRDSYAQLLEGRVGHMKGETGIERFKERIGRLLLDSASMDLSMGRFGLAKAAIDKFLELEPRNAKARFYLGEFYRKRGEGSDTEKAEQEFHIAVQYDASYPEPHRALGFIYLKRGLMDEARNEFEKYLSLVRDADDRQYIEKYLQEIGKR